jgi:sugar/nucleoside kinase (ribokinase family)
LRNWGLYEEDGTRHFVFRSGMRKWEEFSPNVADLDEGPYAFCHLAPLPWELHLKLAAALRARAARLISIDLDDRRLNEVPSSEIARLLGLIDLFMPSRQDIAAIFPGKTPLDALKALREMAPDTPVIVIKCGAAGAIAHERERADPGHLVDLIEVDENTGAFGHGYFLSNPAVRSDLLALISGLKPGDPGRPLVEIRRSFWRIAGSKS